LKGTSDPIPKHFPKAKGGLEQKNLPTVKTPGLSASHGQKKKQYAIERKAAGGRHFPLGVIAPCGKSEIFL